MKSLLLLYKSIIVPILSEWLFDYDLCCLDSAVCSLSLRAKFLELLKELKVFNNKVNIDSFELNGWIDLRQLKYLTCKLTESCFSCERFHSHLSRVRHFEHIETSCLTSLSRLVSLGVTVGSLTVNKCEDTNVTVGNLDCVVSLDISANDDCNFSSLVACCRNLQILKTNRSLDISGAFDLPNIQRIEGVNPAILGLPDSADRIDLRRTTGKADNTTICIGNKTFQMVGLTLYCLNRKDLSVWSTPLLAHLRSLSMYHGIDILLALRSCQLTSLSCWYCVFDENDVVSVLKQSPLLIEVEFVRCTITSKRILQALARHCLKLEKLKIYGLGLDERVVIKLLKSCRNLKDMKFGRRLPTVGMMKCLATSLTSLTLLHGDYLGGKVILNDSKDHLEMLGGSITGYFSVPQLVANNPRLTCINLGCLYDLSNYKWYQLVRGCPLLRKVTLTSMRITSSGLLHLVNCHTLTSLSLSNFQTDVSDKFVHDLLVNRPHFSKLSLYQCGGFTGAVLPMIGLLCPKIRCVEVQYCKVNIQNSDVIDMLKVCTGLYVLGLTGAQVDAEILSFLPSKMRALQVQGTKITDAEVDAHIAVTGFRCSDIKTK